METVPPPQPREALQGTFAKVDQGLTSLADRKPGTHFLMGDLSLLDNLGLLIENSAAPEISGQLDFLKVRCQEKSIRDTLWRAAFAGLRTDQDNYERFPAEIKSREAAVRRHILVAKFLGMDQQVPEIAGFLDGLQNEYGITQVVASTEPPVAVEPQAAVTAKETTTPPQEEEAVRVYGQPWGVVFDSDGSKEEQIGFGYSGHVYRPKKYPGVAVKVFDFNESSGDYARELAILTELQGLPHVVELLGRGEPINDRGQVVSNLRYLVKRFVTGENMYETMADSPYSYEFPLTKSPGETALSDHARGEKAFQEKLAAWLISSMEALEEIHQKDVVLSDFKFADFPWDRERGRTVLIDFGNAVKLGSEYDHGSRSPGHDIDSVLAVLFMLTEIGLNIGMSFSGGTVSWGREGTRRLRTEAENLQATGSLMKIIGFLEESIDRNNPKHHSAGEYAEALKDYFKAVGLYSEPETTQV